MCLIVTMNSHATISPTISLGGLIMALYGFHYMHTPCYKAYSSTSAAPTPRLLKDIQRGGRPRACGGSLYESIKERTSDKGSCGIGPKGRSLGVNQSPQDLPYGYISSSTRDNTSVYQRGRLPKGQSALCRTTPPAHSHTASGGVPLYAIVSRQGKARQSEGGIGSRSSRCTPRRASGCGGP